MTKMTNAPARRASARDRSADPIAAMLDADGRLTPDAERAVRVSDDQLRTLYRQMALARRLDTEALTLQRQGELGLWGPTLGHEAAQVGAAAAMAETDWIFPYYRDWVMAVCRGVDPGTLLTWFRGLAHDVWDPYLHRLAPLIVPVGSQVPHAVGFAMGCAIDGDKTAVLVSFGEGATSTGDWHEAMNFAGVFGAPLVFFCQNNQWAISVPISEQVAGRVADRAAGYGFPGVRLDGTDVLTTYAVVRAAADRARAGDGPYLVEALTYRMGPHTTSDDPTRYRVESDLDPWRARDPLAQCERRLRDRDAWDDAFAAEVKAETDARAAAMRQALLAARPGDPAHVFDLVFANPPDALRRERDEFAAALEPGDEGGDA